jgi:mRNA interferase HigB
MQLFNTELLYAYQRKDPRFKKVNAWVQDISIRHWKTSAELKNDYRSASIINSERVVFNFHGNEYRIVTLINYQSGRMFILWVGTHKEYDAIDVEKL